MVDLAKTTNKSPHNFNKPGDKTILFKTSQNQQHLYKINHYQQSVHQQSSNKVIFLLHYDFYRKTTLLNRKKLNY